MVNLFRRRAPWAALVLSVLFLFSACDSNNSTPQIGGGLSGPPNTQSLLALRITPNTQSILACGFQQQFTATGLFSDGSERDLSSDVTWASSETGAATISNAGLLTTVLPGTTTVSAELNTLRAERLLTVTGSPSPLLRGPQGIVLDEGAEGLTSGDFNGDGILDLAVGFDIRAEVQILFGQASGECREGPKISTGGTIFATSIVLVAANVDGVNGLDIVALNSRDNRFVVLLNDGSGSFSQGQTQGLGLQAEHMVTADFDGQNGPDLVVTDRGSGDFRVFLNNGNGTFSGPTSTVGVSDARQAFAGDLDGQNGPDLAVLNNNEDRIEIYLNQGNGSFGPPTFLSTFNQPASITGGDFDGQNGLDLAVGSEDTSVMAIQVFRNQGNGTFVLSNTLSDAGSSITSLRAADVDGLNGLDLIATDRFEDALLLHLNDGQGGFRTGTHIAVARQPSATVAADLNGDGRTDIVSNSMTGNYLTVLRNRGQAVFPSRVLDFAGHSDAIRFADLDGANGEDLIVIDDDADLLRIALNDGNGNFPAQSTSPIGLASSQIEISDLDGQNGLDIVVNNEGDDSVRVFLNQGNGVFGPQTEIAVGDNPRDFDIADLDGQNGPDIITANRFDDTVSLLMNQGNGTFVAAPVLATRDRPEELLTVDLDGDARPEIVVAGQTDSVLEVFRNQGNGTYAGPTSIGLPSPGTRLLVSGDFDGVNGPDIVVGSEQPNRGVITFLNRGDGTLVNSHTRTTRQFFGPLDLATDLNCDGILDIFVTATSSVFLGRGDGSFAAPTVYGIDSSAAAQADLNGDGLAEMYLVGGDSFGITVLDGVFPETP